ncbi:MAG: adenylyltransferase/cytidyltransferase family protein [Verrucomicrobiota bacterium]
MTVKSSIKPLSVTRPVKVLTLAHAQRWAAAARRRGQCVVATNGCFDLLHFGHVAYLQRAKRLGDLLIIGLNSDVSIRQLKGPSRPLVPERQRAAILAALECVDAVVIFRERQALRFIKTVRPQLYAKGGDYRPDTLDTEERVLLDAIGTKIRIIPFVSGFSTTSLLEKIRKAGVL